MPLVPSVPDDLLIPYGNKSGRSGVTHYATLGEHGEVFLVVFADQSAYAYAEPFVGAEVMQNMRALAEHGEGLATYIAKHRPNGMRIALVFGLNPEDKDHDGS